MKVIALDDEKLALESLVCAIRKAAPEAEVQGFRYGEEALSFARENGCDVAFLDVEVPGMTGVQLSEELKKINRDVNLIFTTGYEQYRKDADDLHGSGYIKKPVTSEKIKRELEELRRPVMAEKRIRVRAFGNFEVFVDGKPAKFRYQKTKELFACLVDREGALCSFGELCERLFEDEEEHKNYFKSLRKDLLDAMNAAGCGDVIVHQRGLLGVRKERIFCDYYDWLDGKQTEPDFQGEYMNQYSWGEYRNAALVEKQNRRLLEEETGRT